jgi:hypothetical protein
LTQALANGGPLSAAVVVDNLRLHGYSQVVIVCYRDGRGSVNFKRIEFDDNSGVEICGAWYAPIALHDINNQDHYGGKPLVTLADMESISETYAAVVAHGGGGNNNNVRRYCVFCKNWKERAKSGTMELPGINDAVFAPPSQEAGDDVAPPSQEAGDDDVAPLVAP